MAKGAKPGPAQQGSALLHPPRPTCCCSWSNCCSVQQYEVPPEAPTSAASCEHTACSLVRAGPASGWAAVLLAQLKGSPSVRCPQMPYVAHRPGSCTSVRQSASPSA